MNRKRDAEHEWTAPDTACLYLSDRASSGRTGSRKEEAVHRSEDGNSVRTFIYPDRYLETGLLEGKRKRGILWSLAAEGENC